MIGYHCTTPKKLKRYIATKAILPPIRFWIYKKSAINWGKKTGRTILLHFEVKEAYPLPDHKPSGHAYWSPEVVRIFKETKEE
jgi:hypothetical protein